MNLSKLGSSVSLSMLFRLAAVLIIAWLVQRHHLGLRENGQRPIRISEVRAFLPDAHRLSLNTLNANGGLKVLNADKQLIGFVSRTMPHSREIKGYSGPSDVLMVFDAEEKLKGVDIRHSYDTPSHVQDVENDYHFMEQWNDMTRQGIAEMKQFKMSKFHIVSGASRTSEAVVKSVTLRSAVGSDVSVKQAKLITLRWHDLALVVATALGLLLTFWKAPLLQKRKVWIHVLMVIYIGIISADLLAQSLFQSWAIHGIPWRNLPGLTILTALAFLTPWATGKPTYCTHICPHGHAQRWIMKIIPARAKLRLGKDEKWSFAILPWFLLCTVVIISFLNLPIDLAGLEPFDAWSLKGVGLATVLVAVVGLLFSLFVPMGYCRYGCPTGYLLNLVKREKQGFHKGDWGLAALLVIALGLYLSA